MTQYRRYSPSGEFNGESVKMEGRGVWIAPPNGSIEKKPDFVKVKATDVEGQEL
ncbi:hypothetical protein OAF71_00595 [bacterium]|nr:hypothetical protein [bacterium]